MLEKLFELRTLVDAHLEKALTESLAVGEVLQTLLAFAVEKTGASAAMLRSYAEDLEIHTYVHPTDTFPALAEVLDRTGESKRENVVLESNGSTIVAQPLDVAGTWFGSAAVAFAKPKSETDVELAEKHLHLICEIVDNYLYAIKAAREKHQVMMDLGSALRHRVLSIGIEEAVAVLARSTNVTRLLLVYEGDETFRKSLHVQLYEHGKPVLGALARAEIVAVKKEAAAFLHEDDPRLLERFGLEACHGETLINGVTRSVRVGKIVASATNGRAFNTHAREMIAGFAGFIRQRVVDFNKEWRHLSASFGADAVARLLQSEHYEEEYLAPREALVAMVYMDIAGFTRISETILKSPALVAKFVEAWSREAVDILFRRGGVFDKMVGDCIIGLFGPPFYDEDPAASLTRAILAADDIRSMTHSFADRAEFPELKGANIGVATGVHMAPLFVGRFGPNANFTGFSSGMNNTARLQGCAKLDQILVMQEAITILGEQSGFAFGEPLSSQVKNVAAPLQYRELVRIDDPKVRETPSQPPPSVQRMTLI